MRTCDTQVVMRERARGMHLCPYHGCLALPIARNAKKTKMLDGQLFLVRPRVPFQKVTNDMQQHILQLKDAVTTWKGTRPKTPCSGNLQGRALAIRREHLLFAGRLGYGTPGKVFGGFRLRSHSTNCKTSVCEDCHTCSTSL